MITLPVFLHGLMMTLGLVYLVFGVYFALLFDEHRDSWLERILVFLWTIIVKPGHLMALWLFGFRDGWKGENRDGKE